MSVNISKSTLNFLSDLKKNNNRPWFQSNKERYEVAKAEISEFLEELKAKMNQTDDIEQIKLFRIYRDIRFSKDKTPYKTHFSMSLSRRKPYLRGGYYLSISSDSGFLGCGFWKPNSSDLKLIRNHLVQDDKPLRGILADQEFIRTFGSLEGEKVKTAPKGFTQDHPAIDLIRYKQFLVSKKYTASEIQSDHFIVQVVSDFQQVGPFFDFMSQILRHDLNGAPLY